MMLPQTGWMLQGQAQRQGQGGTEWEQGAGHLWFMCSMCCGSKHLTWCEHAHKAVSMVFKCMTTGRDAEGCLPPGQGGREFE